MTTADTSTRLKRKNQAVNVVANKEFEELPNVFGSPTRTAIKQGVEISVNMTFHKKKGYAKECGKGKVPTWPNMFSSR